MSQDVQCAGTPVCSETGIAQWPDLKVLLKECTVLDKVQAVLCFLVVCQAQSPPKSWLLQSLTPGLLQAVKSA